MKLEKIVKCWTKEKYAIGDDNKVRDIFSDECDLIAYNIHIGRTKETGKKAIVDFRHLVNSDMTNTINDVIQILIDTNKPYELEIPNKEEINEAKIFYDVMAKSNEIELERIKQLEKILKTSAPNGIKLNKRKVMDAFQKLMHDDISGDEEFFELILDIPSLDELREYFGQLLNPGTPYQEAYLEVNAENRLREK